MPKNSQAPFVLFQGPHVLDDGIDAEVLMVFRHHLYQSLPLFAKENEVLGNIEQPFLCARTTENGLQAYDRMFFFVVDLFPFRKMFVQGSDGSEFALEAAGKDDERIVQKR